MAAEAAGGLPGRSRMLLPDLLRVGSIGLRTRRLRAALSAVGIAIGIASMVAVVGISESSRSDLVATLDRLGTNLLTVSAGQGLFDAGSGLTADARPMIGRIGAVEQVASVTAVDANVYRTDLVPEEESGGISVVAADVNLLATLGASVQSGRFLDAATAAYPATVLGAIAAARLGIARADGTQRVWLGDEWFVVVGILAPVELAGDLDRAAVVGLPMAQARLGADDQPSTLYVRARPAQIDAVADVLPATARPDAPEEVEVARPSDALEARAAVDESLAALLVGLGAVALLVGGVGIANVMVIAVLERRQEIGLRRALGARRVHITGQFLCESLLLAGLGGLVGVSLGALVTAAYAWSRGWSAALPVPYLVAALVAALVIGAIAGLYPALRAARLAPTEALRSV